MVIQDNRNHVCQAGNRLENIRADHRMLLDDVEFFRRERSRLKQNIVADADFADVVQPAADADHFDFLIARIHERCHAGHDLRHGFGMAARVGIPRFKGGNQAGNAAEHQ